MSYTITAKLDNKVLTRRFSYHDSDDEALMEASFLVLDLAHQHPESAWAKGEVTLSDGLGRVIEVMPRKES